MIVCVRFHVRTDLLFLFGFFVLAGEGILILRWLKKDLYGFFLFSREMKNILIFLKGGKSVLFN